LPYCRKCGVKLEENAHFCDKCGTQVAATFVPPTQSAPMRPIRSDPLFVVGMVLIAIVISAIIIGAIIFVVFHLDFSQSNASQQNVNSLYLFNSLLHRQIPVFTLHP